MPDDRTQFLKSLQVLPPGTKSLVVDETYQPRPWPPAPDANRGVETTRSN